jgi:hypothetical protein
VKPDALDLTNAEGGGAERVLQPAELPLHGGTTAVQGRPLVRAAAASFGGLSRFVGDVTAAPLGLALYTGVLAAVRPRGLREAWSYVRALD